MSQSMWTRDETLDFGTIKYDKQWNNFWCHHIKSAQKDNCQQI